MGDRENGWVKAYFERNYQDVHAIAERALRHEHPNHTLRPTEIVHLAYARLCKQRNLEGADQQKMTGAAVVTIRRILIDHARKKKRRPLEGFRIPLDSAIDLQVPPDIDWITVDEALDALEKKDPMARGVADLLLFNGSSIQDAARLLGISPDAAAESWRFAKAWLHLRLDAP